MRGFSKEENKLTDCMMMMGCTEGGAMLAPPRYWRFCIRMMAVQCSMNERISRSRNSSATTQWGGICTPNWHRERSSVALMGPWHSRST